MLNASTKRKLTRLYYRHEPVVLALFFTVIATAGLVIVIVGWP
jgi:hypothetical protein